MTGKNSKMQTADPYFADKPSSPSPEPPLLLARGEGQMRKGGSTGQNTKDVATQINTPFVFLFSLPR